MPELTSAHTIAAALNARKQPDGTYLGDCPAHGHRANFHITPAGDRTIFRCMAGCEQDAVLKALTARGLWGDTSRPQTALPPTRPVSSFTPPPGAIVYRYSPTFVITRVDTPLGKKIRPWTYADGKWIPKAPTGPRPLYRLEALSDLATVLICEGEKAADAAADLVSDALERGRLREPIAVISWSGGSSAPHLTDWSPLAGRDVIIWPDNDAPGLKAAQTLETLLRPIARTVRTLDPVGEPNSGDDAADVTELPPITRQPRVTLTASTAIASSEFRPLKHVLHDLMPEGFVLLSGPPKAAKSMLATDLCCCVATGRPFLGHESTRSGTLYIDGESGPRGMKHRLNAVRWDGGAEGFHVMNPPAEWQLNAEGIADVEHFLDADPSIQFVVFDTLERLFPHPGNSRGLDAYQFAVRRLAPIQSWISKRGITALVLHHTNKYTGKQSKTGEDYDNSSGSRGLTGTAETLMTLMRVNQEGLYRLKVTPRYMAEKTLFIRHDGGKWQLAQPEEADTKMTPERKSLLLYAANNPTFSIKDFAMVHSMDLNRAKHLVYRAREAGQIVQLDRGMFKLLK